MTARLPDSQGLLVLPRLNIQNANAISSPMTHGFLAMTAFLGLMWALERKLPELGLPSLTFNSVGVICHGCEEEVQDGYVKSFRLSRNPVGKDGAPAAIVEEGRMNLDVTLVFGVVGARDGAANVLLASEPQRDDVACRIGEVVSTMRIAGGTVLPTRKAQPRAVRPRLLAWDEDDETRAARFRGLRRQWLPGSVLVGRDDLLALRLEQLRQCRPESTLLDAWLDLSRFNWRPAGRPAGAPDDEKVAWTHDRTGWIVPIPVGYAALSPLQPAGSVLRARDDRTPFRFVETIYSMGEWLGVHRLEQIGDMLWYADTEPDSGLYRCRNDYPQRRHAWA